MAPALIDEGGSGALAREVLKTDGDAHVPHLLDAEVLSMVRGHTRAGRLEPERAEEALVDLDDWPLTRYAHLGLLAGAWRLRHNVSACDAIYAALAETIQAPLVTADARLVRASGLRCEVRLLDSLSN